MTTDVKNARQVIDELRDELQDTIETTNYLLVKTTIEQFIQFDEGS
ncbi:hypothetical protein [Hazenella coriacea]|nr:hypothetical protein [Hazenella coriacea]